jgi:hypothetical protein
MSTQRAQHGSTRARLAAVLAATAVCGAVAVATAPGAAAAPDAGGGACPSGYAATSANGTFVGAPVPAGTSGPSKGNGRSTTSAPRYGELVGTGCLRHTGDTAEMRFSWSSVGPLLSGTFVYQLFDCTTGGTSHALTRRLGYPTGGGTSGGAEATLAVDPAHTYRMRITGEGSYQRRTDGFSGVAGYWSVSPPAGNPAWTDQTPCA